MSSWCNVDQPIPMADGNFQRILRFYLFECPVTFDGAPVSARGVPLERRGWQGAALRTLLARMKQGIRYLEIRSDTDVDAAVKNEEAASSLSDPRFELIAFREDSRLGKTRTILYMIRNAFAHGSFCVERTDRGAVYWFSGGKDGNVRARIRLKEETLLRWIDLIQSPAPTGKRGKKVPTR